MFYWLLVLLSGASPGPSEYTVRLETSKGLIVIAVHRDWAPNGADRFHELVETGYYDEARFFRIRAGTWAQFGIHGEPKVAQAWRTKTIPDDPWKGVSNTRGTVAYAFKDPNGRTTQVFINLKDNLALDKSGFAPIGRVVEGMEVVAQLYSSYGEMAPRGNGPDPQRFEREGKSYLDRAFPRLDYIKRASILP